MPTTDDTDARTHICPACGGAGYTAEPVCCERGANGCGSVGCTGTEADQVECQACNGSGVVE